MPEIEDKFSTAILEDMQNIAPQEPQSPEPPQKEEPKSEPEVTKDPKPESEPEVTKDPKPESEPVSDKENNMKALRESRDDLKAQLSDVQAKLDQLSEEYIGYKSQYDQERFSALENERKELAVRLAELDAYQSPKVSTIKQQLDQDISQAAQAIRRMAPELKANIEAILKKEPELRDAELAEVLQDAPSAAQSRLWSHVDRIDQRRNEIEREVENTKKEASDWKTSIQQKRDEAEKKRTEQMSQLFRASLRKAQSDDEGLPEFFAEKEGADDHNKLVRDSINYARHIMLDPLSETETAQAAFLAGAGKAAINRMKVLMQALTSSETERKALASRVEELEKAAPGTSQSGVGNAGVSGEEPDFARDVMKIARENNLIG